MAFSFVQTPGLSPFYDFAALRSTVADLNVTSYTNPNGETLTPDQFGMKRIIGADVLNCPRGFVVQFTRVNQGTSLKMTIAQDNGTATAGALPEIPNTTNFGSLTIQVIGQ